MGEKQPDRAVVFVDGNNWYHALKAAGVTDRARLDYAKISLKLVGPRQWTGTRYYIGRVPQSGNRKLYADQRSFLAALTATDQKITAHLGRLESRPVKNELAEKLAEYLAGLSIRIDRNVYRHLVALARTHRNATRMVEKAVDVMLAVDMVVMAERDEFDAAYILTADGDPYARRGGGQGAR